MPQTTEDVSSVFLHHSEIQNTPDPTAQSNSMNCDTFVHPIYVRRALFSHCAKTNYTFSERTRRAKKNLFNLSSCFVRFRSDHRAVEFIRLFSVHSVHAVRWDAIRRRVHPPSPGNARIFLISPFSKRDAQARNCTCFSSTE